MTKTPSTQNILSTPPSAIAEPQVDAGLSTPPSAREQGLPTPPQQAAVRPSDPAPPRRRHRAAKGPGGRRAESVWESGQRVPRSSLRRTQARPAEPPQVPSPWVSTIYSRPAQSEGLMTSGLVEGQSPGHTYHHIHGDPCIVAHGVVDQLLRLILKLVCSGLRNPRLKLKHHPDSIPV